MGSYRWSHIALMRVGKQQKFRKGRRKEEKKRKKTSLVPVWVTILVLIRLGQNQSSFRSAFLKPIQFHFRFSRTNPVSIGQLQLRIQSSFSWGKENQSRTSPIPIHSMVQIKQIYIAQNAGSRQAWHQLMSLRSSLKVTRGTWEGAHALVC